MLEIWRCQNLLDLIRDPLSKDGWEQMHHSVEKNKADWSAIVSSPMLRCIDFATHLSEKHNIPLQVIENLREAGYGAWEGRTPAQVEQDSEYEYWNFFADPVNNRPENSEPLEFFTPRINEVFAKVLTEYQGQHVLLISHLAVIRAITGIILGMPLASQQLIDMPFAGMIQIINDRKGLRLLFL